MQLRFFVAMGADMQRFAALPQELVSAPNVIDVSPVRSDRVEDRGRASESLERRGSRLALASARQGTGRERAGAGRLRGRTPNRAFSNPRESVVTDPSKLTVGRVSFAAGLHEGAGPVLDVTV